MKKILIYVSGFAIVAIAVMVLSIASCKKPETIVTPAPPSNEFLTTVIFRCINSVAPFDTTTGVWRELNPSGSLPPDTSKAILNYKKNSTYVCNIYILDESKTATDSLVSTNFNINKLPSTTVNVTTEIRARQNYHLICMNATGGIATNWSFIRTDYDTNNPPLQVGLNDNVTTLATSTGRLEITLHHQPNVKNGTCGPGTDDFDVFYSVNIQ